MFHVRYDVQDSKDFFWREIETLPALGDQVILVDSKYIILSEAYFTGFSSWIVKIAPIDV